ncbi:MAG: ArgE/DapE family deacylase [Actinobacteria bacterium]|nr:ArgE/DapE family deacylase [Actinomycetota bacterium]
MSLDALEQRVADEIGRGSDELVALAGDLVRFDTTTRVGVDDPPRQEAALQQYLASRLSAAGAACDLWEPTPDEVPPSKIVPPGLRFDGRPQLAGRFAAAGEGRSLLLNGHIDVVSPEPCDRWTNDPNEPVVRDGKLYGRGSCDMKGGVAAMVFAAEILARLGVRLAGDLVVCTVTEEESTGAGGVAAVAHGVRADAGIVTEASDFDVWIACRGSIIPTITVLGRPGHAGKPHPHWRAGGAVNAIEKATVVMDALRRLQDDWRGRPDQEHAFLSPGDIVPVVIAGGEWIVSYPASCRLTYHVGYLPAHADQDGWGTAVERELIEWVEKASSTDSWLAENLPTFEWAPEVPSAEISADEPIVLAMHGAAVDVGRPGRIGGLDNWHDGATFTRFGGTPCICFGPSGLDVAHTIDEYVPVADLVQCSQAVAVAAMRFCGVAAAD